MKRVSGNVVQFEFKQGPEIAREWEEFNNKYGEEVDRLIEKRRTAEKKVYREFVKKHPNFYVV